MTDQTIFDFWSNTVFRAQFDINTPYASENELTLRSSKVINGGKIQVDICLARTNVNPKYILAGFSIEWNEDPVHKTKILSGSKFLSILQKVFPTPDPRDPHNRFGYITDGPLTQYWVLFEPNNLGTLLSLYDMIALENECQAVFS